MRALIVVSLVAASVGAAVAFGGVHDRDGGGGCHPALVHYTSYPGRAPGLGGLPWVRATSNGLGLVALLWYWPSEWRQRQVDRAFIFPGATTPSGLNTKVLWVFLSGKAKRTADGSKLIVRGHRLDGSGQTWQQFVPISYAGQNRAPSYASIIDLPSAGCWRLQLGAGRLRANVVFEAAANP